MKSVLVCIYSESMNSTSLKYTGW